MAASRFQTDMASRARLQDELGKLFAQQLAAGGTLGDTQLSASRGSAEPLDQPRLANDQAVAACRADERAVAADEANTEVRRCLRQKLCGGIAEAALIEEEEVEAS